MIKLSIIEDNFQIRNVLSSFIELQEDIELLSSHDSLESFLVSGKTMIVKPEILILDLQQSGINGLQGLTLIMKDFPAIEVIIYSNQLEENVILKALIKGAFYYASKLDSMHKLLDQTRMIYNGRTQIHTLWARELLKIIRNEKNYFTAEETYLVNALSVGSSYSKIADDSNCSVASVESASKNLLSRLHGLQSARTYH